MAKCPECGGDMIGRMKRKICQSCGLSLSGSEYDKLWDKNRDSMYEEENEKRTRDREYKEWYAKTK